MTSPFVNNIAALAAAERAETALKHTLEAAFDGFELCGYTDDLDGLKTAEETILKLIPHVLLAKVARIRAEGRADVAPLGTPEEADAIIVATIEERLAAQVPEATRAR